MKTWRRILRIVSSVSTAICMAAVASAMTLSASASVGETAVSDMVFQWGVNPESGGGSYFGGCNFLSAGTSGDAGTSGVWSENSGLWKQTSANVEILKPDAEGNMLAQTWTNKCQNRYGTSINDRTSGMNMAVSGGNPATQPSYSENVVRISGGSGSLNPSTNSATVTWDGSFTIVYYGGMTYWTISDLKLVVLNGKGTITGTASGYGADMDDPATWLTLPSTPIHVADLSDVQVSESGITVTPDYLGVSVSSEIQGRNPQAERTASNESWWGAFPDSWLQYAVLTGQSSYWYTSDGGAGTIQPRKVVSAMTIARDTVSVVASQSVVQAGREITFNIKAPQAGKEYQAGIRAGSDGQWVLLDEIVTISQEGSASLRYTVPAASATGSYAFAIFEKGDAANPVASTTYTVGRLPGAPTGLVVGKPEGTSVSLTWVAPDDLGLPAISAYVATAIKVNPTEGSAGDADVVSASFDGADADSGILSALEAGATYQISVAAQNAIGAGPSSNAVQLTVPGAAQDDDDDDPVKGGTTISNATLRWGMNDEANSAAYYGGCNFLSAGKSGDSGKSTVWTDGSLYSASSGNVRIQKPNTAGQWEAASWGSRCLTRDGTQVTTQKRVDGRSVNTESQVVVSDGEGVVAADGSTSIRWTGSWTVVFYGGMTYWSVSDPRLTLDADGNGQLTATASGYGADMDDSTKWNTLSDTTVVLADLKKVDVDKAAEDHGFTQKPEYLGVAVNSTGGRNQQAAKTADNAAYWGSFPQSFVDFQMLTGQSSYWYTSDGARDYAKPATALSIAYDGSYSVPVPEASETLDTTAGSAGTSGTSSGGSPGVGASSAGSAQNPSKATGSAGAGEGGSSQLGDQADGASAVPIAAVRDTAVGVAAASGAVALASGLPLGAAWVIRRRLGLDPAFELDRSLGL